MNKIRGQIELEIGGQVYQARLSINSLCALETVLDSPITEIVSNFAAGVQRKQVSIRVVRAFLWAMLRDSASGITLEGAGLLIDETPPGYIVAKIVEILPLTFPDPEGESGEQRPT